MAIFDPTVSVRRPTPLSYWPTNTLSSAHCERSCDRRVEVEGIRPLPKPFKVLGTEAYLTCSNRCVDIAQTENIFLFTDPLGWVS